MSAPAAARQGGVLVVEDEDDAREMMCELVELGGCTALTAANGAEALKVLAKVRPCFIVLDLLMPVMDGVTFLAEVRKKPELADIPVVIATSAPHLAPKGSRVMVKPIEIGDLWDMMKRWCVCAGAKPAGAIP